MRQKSLATSSNKARTRSRKTNGDATLEPASASDADGRANPRLRHIYEASKAAAEAKPEVRPTTSDPILDDLIGLNRKAFQIAGRRIEFRRDGEFTTLERREMGVLTLERQRLSILCVPDVRTPDVSGAISALSNALAAAKAITETTDQSVEETRAAEDAMLKVVLEDVLTARQALESPLPTSDKSTPADCNRLDKVIREIGTLITVGDLSDLGPLDLEHIIDIFFQLRLETVERKTIARASIALTLAQTLPTI